MNIEKIKKDIIYQLNYVPEMSQTTYNALKGALDIINAIEDIKAEIEELEQELYPSDYRESEVFEMVLDIINKHIEGV